MTRKLTAEQVDTLRELYVAGENLRVIAERVGCSVANVSSRAHKMGLPMRQRMSSDYPQRAIVAAYRQGMSANRIAEEVGCRSHCTVVDILKANGVRIRGRNGQWPDLRAECVRMFRAGLFYREIGARLGLTMSQVQRRVHMVLGAGSKADGGHRRSARRFRPSGLKGVPAAVVHREQRA